jgi:L-threonylcarbamoyladenylate synthase
MIVLRPEDLEKAVELLKDGKVLIYPTETSYALGCDATNDAAVKRIFAIKGRPDGKGTPVILPNDADPEKFIMMNGKALSAIEDNWPGPLNIVGKRKEGSEISLFCETAGTQSVRKSSYTLASELSRLSGRPIVATSANRSGSASLYKAEDILREFYEGELPDAFLNAGDLPVTLPSTTVRVEGEEIAIVRQGEIVL